MTIWQVADSLDQLLGQLDAIAPERSRASDGGLGDGAHQGRKSDHNPHVVLAGQHYVTARDFTHDPAGGLDCHRLAAALRRARDARLKYVIWDGQIMSGAGGPQPWTWRPYRGANQHRHHLHLSVVADRRCLDRAPWALPGPEPLPTTAPPLKRGSRGATVRSLQLWLANSAWVTALPLLAADGVYGARTEAVVKAAQGQCGLVADGIVGPHTRVAFVMRGWRP